MDGVELIPVTVVWDLFGSFVAFGSPSRGCFSGLLNEAIVE